MTTDALPGEGRYFVVVKFDLQDPATEGDFNAWYNVQHLPDLVSGAGLDHGWRTKELRNAPNEGAVEQPFFAWYQMDTSERFRRPPRPPEGAAPPPPTDPPPRRIDMSGMRLAKDNAILFYELVGSGESDVAAGEAWAREEYAFSGSDAERAAFEQRAIEALAATLKLDGVHRGWLLRSQTTDLQVGGDAAGNYLALYQVDSPDSFTADGRPTPDAPRVGLHFSEPLFDISHDDAIATVAAREG